MPSGMTALAAAFRKISLELQATLASSGVNPHGVTKGCIREQQLLEALRPHVPTRFEMRLGGVVVNVLGGKGMGESTAQDIVITDGLVASPFMFGNQIHPIEALSAVVEVKSDSTKEKIVEAVEQIASVKRLLENRLWRRDELDRVRAGGPTPSLFGAIFCYSLSGRPNTVVKNFKDACLAKPPKERPDTLCVLNSFTTQWRSDTNIMVPLSATSSITHEAKDLLRYDTTEAALFFYMLLLERLGRYQPPPLDLMWYLSNSEGIDFEVEQFELPTDQ